MVLCLGIGSTSIDAQDAVPDAEVPVTETGVGLDPTLKSALNPELLETKIKEAEAAIGLDEVLKTRLIEQYRKALSDLQAARAFDDKAGAYKQSLEGAPARTAAIREELAARAATPKEDVSESPDDASITEIEQVLAKAQADAAAVATKLAEIEKELEASTTRPNDARQAIDKAKQDLEAVETEAVQTPPPEQAQSLSDARRWALDTRRQSLRSKVLMLDQELLTHGVRVELLNAAREKAGNELTQLKSSIGKLDARLGILRAKQAVEATKDARQAQRQAADKHPLVQTLAQDNAELAEEIVTQTDALNKIAGMQELIETQTRRVEEGFRGARQRVEAAGLTRALGQVLIDQRNQLPDLRHYRKEAALREEMIADTTLRQIHYAEEARQVQDTESYVSARMSGQVADGDQTDVIVQLRDLATQRGALLKQVSHTQESFLRMLGELDHASVQLIEATENYAEFLDERLLWVRSGQPLDLGTFTGLPQALLWAVAPPHWMEVGQVLLYEATRSPAMWALLLIVALVESKARSLRRHIRATAEPLRRISTDGMSYTLRALSLSLLLAVPIPLLLATIGWQLYASLDATDFTKAIGQAALSVSVGFYYLRAFRVLCMTVGVADRHFRWDGDILAQLRRSFDWLFATLLPLGFVATAAYTHPNPVYSGSLGRVAMLVLMIGLAIFFARILNPRSGVLRNLIEEHPDGWLNRLRKLWYPTITAIPLALAMLTAAGYQYTAGILLASLISSMYLALAITVIHQSIIRWLVLTRRRLALQAALDRRSARAAEQSAQTRTESTSAPQLEEPAEDVDLAALDEQTRSLVNTLLFIGTVAALWGIWAQVLPAFGLFDRIALWYHTGVVDGVEHLVPVTLGDVGMVLVIGLIGFVAAKNLPALLEILLLSRVSLSAGSRYAVKTLAGYVIATTAILMAFSALGLSWDQVQWLVAALSLGIGFGLQEIVANFISGIIILFERPVAGWRRGHHRRYHGLGHQDPHPCHHHPQLGQAGAAGSEQGIHHRALAQLVAQRHDQPYHHHCRR